MQWWLRSGEECLYRAFCCVGWSDVAVRCFGAYGVLVSFDEVDPETVHVDGA